MALAPRLRTSSTAALYSAEPSAGGAGERNADGLLIANGRTLRQAGSIAASADALLIGRHLPSSVLPGSAWTALEPSPPRASRISGAGHRSFDRRVRGGIERDQIRHVRLVERRVS